MLLVIDIGNTNSVLGLFDGDELLRSFRIETTTSRTHDELGLMDRPVDQSVKRCYTRFQLPRLRGPQRRPAEILPVSARASTAVRRVSIFGGQHWNLN